MLSGSDCSHDKFMVIFRVRVNLGLGLVRPPNA